MTSFMLNGQSVSAAADHPHLLAALRDELGVISPKDGCRNGQPFLISGRIFSC